MKRLVIYFCVLIVALACSREGKVDVVEKHYYYLGYSEFVTDSVFLENRANNGFMIYLVQDNEEYLKYLSENNLDRDESYKTPLYVSLAEFSDKKLAEALSNIDSTPQTITYWTSYISGKVSITSSDSLFGETPGEDISEHFSVLSELGNIPLLKSDNYNIMFPSRTDKPEELKDFFYQGHVLLTTTMSRTAGKYLGGYTSYGLVLKEFPTEPCSSTVLTIAIPVEENLYLDAFDISGKFDESKVSHRNRILKGSIEMTF